MFSAMQVMGNQQSSHLMTSSKWHCTHEIRADKSDGKREPKFSLTVSKNL